MKLVAIPYNPEVGRLATLELYALRNNNWRSEDQKRYNWRLLGANGEPIARGSGERNGGFSTPIRAWYNALLVADILHGELPRAMPKLGKLMMIVDRDSDGPKPPRLCIKRTA